ncbi:alpha/beta fold hydrolase (plasmid) [Rhodococcoides fascians]|uniref:alpha/beta fold hydrolase n=1 Tax=Rhodococcoides fascians TaxID=1828 RepID=UPI00389B293A
MTATPRVAELEQGTIEYRVHGSDGPVIVLLHGALVDGRVWEPVLEQLSSAATVVVPELPLGAHRIPMPVTADLSVHGVVELIDSLLAHLDLTDVTIVGSDTGSVYCQVMAVHRPDRLAGIVLTPGDMFEQFPPRVFKHLGLLSRLPDPVVRVLMWHVTTEAGKYLPTNFGWMLKRRIPKDVTDGWVLPSLRDRRILKDAKKVLASMQKAVLLENAPRLKSFTKPVLLIWATEDHFWPPAQAYRLAGMIPTARVEEVADAFTLVTWDQPTRVADLIGNFVNEEVCRAAAGPAHKEEQT